MYDEALLKELTELENTVRFDSFDFNDAYALGSARADMRPLSRTLNGCLAGRGGGSALMAQGTFRADAESIRQAFLAEAGKLPI